MLYLSMFFILSGAMLLLYAVITGLSEKKVLVPSGREKRVPQRADSAPRAYEKVRGEEERAFPGEKLDAGDAVAVHEAEEPLSPRVHVYEETADPAAGVPDPGDREIRLHQADEETSSVETKEDPVPAEEDLDSAGAVLYEDASRLVDYSREKGIIDPDIEHYREIRRINEGNLVLENEGFSFHCGRKFFRFDFIKVEKIFFSQNSIAIIYGAGSPVRLFLLREGTPLLERARISYDDFVEHMTAREQ